jgi:hypothetical protein
MDAERAVKIFEELGACQDAFAFDIRMILMPAMKRVVEDECTQSDNRFLTIETSGLSDYINSIGGRLKDNECNRFCREDVLNAVRAIDAYWSRLFNSTELRCPSSSLDKSCAEEINYNDHESIQGFARWLNSSLLLPASSIAEWRRERYLSIVAIMLEVASGSLRIHAKNSDTRRQIIAILERGEVAYVVNRAISIVNDPPLGKEILTEDLVRLYNLRLDFRKWIDIVEKASVNEPKNDP